MTQQLEAPASAPMSAIEKAVSAMMKENTGAHFLDSGGAYGRSWQRNQQVKDFRDKPVVNVEVYKDGEISATVDIFHFLTALLEVNKDSTRLSRELYRLSTKAPFEREAWRDVCDAFNRMYLEPNGYRMTRWDNVYNYDNMLSQVYTYAFIYSEDNEDYPEFIIMELHNGCDVRGGYTKPRIFAISDFDEFIMAQHDLDASCKCTGMYSDDCGYHWYVGNEPAKTQLDELLGIEREKLQDGKFPKYWKADAENDKLTCQCCKHEVKITSLSVEYGH